MSCLRSDAARSKGTLIVGALIVVRSGISPPPWALTYLASQLFSLVALGLTAAGLGRGSNVSCKTYTSNCVRVDESFRVKLSSGAGGFGVRSKLLCCFAATRVTPFSPQVAANVLILLLASFVVVVGIQDAAICDVGAPLAPLGARLRHVVLLALIVVAVLSLAAAVAVAKSAADKANDEEDRQSVRCAACQLFTGDGGCSCGIGGVAIGGAAMDVLVLVTAIVGIVLSVAILRRDAPATAK